jgi:hypothetical protein
MRFCFRKWLVIPCGMGIAFFCSCEQHHVGELPAERHFGPGHESEQHEEATAAQGRVQKADVTPSASVTPVEFFPEQKNP